MTFEPPMSNIPLWNLREEFHNVREMLHGGDFVAALRSNERPIKTPILHWHGSDADLLSLLVQRAVLGVESYTVGAAWIKLSELGRMTSELNKKVRNPFSIQAKSGTASAYYHNLPALIHPDLSVAVVDPEFWTELKDFYRNVRNPLFHGSHFASGDIHNAIKSFWFIEELYAWLDQWHKPEWVPGQRLTLVIRADD
jgi:hypothetical protein